MLLKRTFFAPKIVRMSESSCSKNLLKNRQSLNVTSRDSCSIKVPDDENFNIFFVIFFHLLLSFYPLSCSRSFNLSFPRRLASPLELGSQVGSTTDQLSSCYLIQHIQDYLSMRAEPAEVIANIGLMIFFVIFCITEFKDRNSYKIFDFRRKS